MIITICVTIVSIIIIIVVVVVVVVVIIISPTFIRFIRINWYIISWWVVVYLLYFEDSFLQNNLSLTPPSTKFQVNSVQFIPLTDRVVRVGGGNRRFSGDSLPFFFCRRPLWAVLAQARMSTLSCCPPSISSADQGVAHTPRCPGLESLSRRVTLPNPASFRLLTVARGGSCRPTR